MVKVSAYQRKKCGYILSGDKADHNSKIVLCSNPPEVISDASVRRCPRVLHGMLCKGHFMSVDCSGESYEHPTKVGEDKLQPIGDGENRHYIATRAPRLKFGNRFCPQCGEPIVIYGHFWRCSCGRDSFEQPPKEYLYYLYLLNSNHPALKLWSNIFTQGDVDAIHAARDELRLQSLREKKKGRKGKKSKIGDDQAALLVAVTKKLGQGALED